MGLAITARAVLNGFTGMAKAAFRTKGRTA